MRKVIVLFLTLASLSLQAQRKIIPTDSFTIQGKIKKEKVFTLADLDTFPKVDISNLTRYNQKGEIKDTLKNMKGVMLKTLFEQTEFIYEKPKTLNELYFVFMASDGYKVVFSWNEIFNTETGNNFFIVTEMEGRKLADIPDRILFLSAKDLKTGRRYIKSLEKIIVKQVD